MHEKFVLIIQIIVLSGSFGIGLKSIFGEGSFT